jgi:hypothetical protein
MTIALSPDIKCSACAACLGYACDNHAPPACVCDTPAQGWMNECATCHRPYGPRFAAVRAAWREHLGMTP